MISATNTVTTTEDSWICFDDHAPLVRDPPTVVEDDATESELLDGAMLAASAFGGEVETAAELIDETTCAVEGAGAGVESGVELSGVTDTEKDT